MNTGGYSQYGSDWTDNINAWVLWDSATLLMTAAVFGYYIYFAVAIIMAAMDNAAGKYVESTALLNQNWSVWVFVGLNGTYFINSIAKVLMIRYVNETATILDNNQLQSMDDLGFYLWDPDFRLLLDIEGWTEIFPKLLAIGGNFFIYWQWPELFVLLMKT